jgi:hypothetical protein
MNAISSEIVAKGEKLIYFSLSRSQLLPILFFFFTFLQIEHEVKWK